MRSWCAALGVAVLVGLVAACGDEAGTPKKPATQAGAAGEGTPPTNGGAPGGGANGGGGSEAGGGIGGLPTSVDVTEYCGLLSQAYVAWLIQCYGSAQYPEPVATKLADEARQSCQQSESGVSEARLAFDEAAALSCLRALELASCDGFDFIGSQPDCAGVFAPRAEVGDDCFEVTTGSALLGVKSECQNGFCDVSQTCPGVCAAFKADGQPCATSSECVPESYCGEDGCTPRKGAFSECSGDTCLPGLSCVYPPDAMFGLCMARSTPGQSCSDDEPCSLGFYCIGGQCRSKVDSGEACELTLNCADGERCLDRDGEGLTCGPPGTDGVTCREGNDCAATHFCPISAPRVCTARVSIGEPCMTGECTLGAWCNLEQGECQAPRAEGESCRVSGSLAQQACQTGLFCMADGECHAVGGNGEPCNPYDPETCASDLFCSRSTYTCQAAEEEGGLCNPFSPSTCAGDLGCLCSDPACEPDIADPMVEDSLHTCLPRRAIGQECYRDEECADGSSCLGGALGTCTATRPACAP